MNADFFLIKVDQMIYDSRTAAKTAAPRHHYQQTELAKAVLILLTPKTLAISNSFCKPHFSFVFFLIISNNNNNNNKFN